MILQGNKYFSNLQFATLHGRYFMRQLQFVIYRL
jgi:hypothetical protein